ncbi:MAG: 50S ribosomal protein L24 [Deltaproteobacteria bacterium]|nr:50S ribosomal protein L24 [Deltaproteobacteria bacterium]
MQRLKVKDIVEVISGNHKGSQGKILKFNPDKSRAYVEKVALVKKHLKASRSKQNPTGGIIEKESSVHISNLMLVDPSNKKPGKIGVKILKDNTKVRFFKKTGTELKA